MDGEARKWFRELPTGLIAGIDALDATFFRHWGDIRDYLFYITEFGALKRNGESLSDFTKIFNKMYQKNTNEIKPSETSTMITYGNAFVDEFSLLLRERRSTNLAAVQESTIEVESNILEVERLKGESDRGIKDKKKKKEE